MVATALGDVGRAMGISQIARDTGVAREALYKALSPHGNPELSTIMRVLGAIGLELSVRPRRAPAPAAAPQRPAVATRAPSKKTTATVAMKPCPHVRPSLQRYVRRVDRRAPRARSSDRSPVALLGR